MTGTEQLLRRMAGSITAYMDEVGARPLRMSTADRAVLAVRDGELYAFSSLALQITEPEERYSLLVESAGRPGAVGRRMAKLMMLGTKAPYPEDVWLAACKRAVDTGDLQRVRMMLDRTMDKADSPSPSLPGEVLRYACLQNPAMGRDLIRWTPQEQIAAAPAKLLCTAAYARDLPMLTELLRKGLQPGDHAAPLLLPLLTAYDEQRVAHLLKDSLRVLPEDYEAMNVCLREHAPAAAEALLDQGMKLDGYLAWAAERGTMLDNRAREILEELKLQQDQAHSLQQQGSGPTMGGMSL